ncbi:MAG: carboxypeptidase regulatory-like domain-containing protein [Bryobacteraceae bacterium]
MRLLRVRLGTILAALAIFSTSVFAQSLTTGDILGTVTDPSGAAIPNAGVTLKGVDTGTSQNTRTNQSGEYRFTLLKPGRYTVAASETGFQTREVSLSVAVGQAARADLNLEVGTSTTTVEVTAGGTLINTEPASITSFTQAQMELLPTAGGDITNIAFTAPGTVVNVTAGYGNFTVNGLPATSNLFTINGENYMDPYFNINNTGATNLSIGQNEIQEATVISNPYAGQYGQLAGAQVTYITKSGTNDFHGNAQYLWNGRALNANNWINNSTGTPRPFANANQWAASIGGPIIKNKTFFFVDNEGLRFVLPNVIPTNIPTPAFATAVLTNIQATQPAEYPTYQKLFGLWQGAPGAASAQPIIPAADDPCRSLVLPGFTPGTPCAATFQATPTALASEYVLGFRVDQKISDNDDAFFRYKLDHGTQPTHLDAISPNFDALSKQPSWDAQFNETHIFGPRSTNSFMATLSHYVAQFAQNHTLAAGTFPYDIITTGEVNFGALGSGVYETNPLRSYPQGRNITQYQFIDDFTLNRGKHNLKFGVNFRRYDVSDHNFFYNSPAVYFGYVPGGLQNFVDGLAYQYRQALNLSSDVPVAMWGLGLYAQDEWNVTPNLKLTLALRAERNSNPVCQTNCFANFKTGFNGLASVTNADPGSVPYSADIAANQHQAYPGVDFLDWSPRFGFSWSPGGHNKTVISGGFGIFYDSPPAGLVDDLLANPPVSVTFRVRPTEGVAPFDPAGAPAIWQAAANTFNIQKSYNQIATSLAALGVSFPPPAFTAVNGIMHAPEWQEWNFQIQQQLSNSYVLSLNYAGNHGVRIPYDNAWPNAFDQYGLYPGVPGVPGASAVPNYGVVTSVQNGAISNYNGLTVTLAKQFSHGFAGHFNYTWSHNLDEASNGGVFTYGDSLLGQINPVSLRANNYGNSDYDIRHNISADFIYSPGFRFGNRFLNAALGGWQWSWKVFWRTGLPFSVVDGNTAVGNYNGNILATPLAGAGPAQTTCNSSSTNGATPCLNANAFVNAAPSSFPGYTQWSGQGRNAFRGPHYFNTDMALFKNFKITERFNFGLGAQAFNVVNHPNFALPDSTLGDSTFGQILTMAGTPTSPYGNFLGFDSSPRVLQVSGKITF